MENKLVLLNNKNFPKINFKYIDKHEYKKINEEEYNNLIINKNKIDNLNNHKLWDRAKKLSNDYELIHLPNKKMKSYSIALYEPLSRSYFKLWEILFDFKFDFLFKKEKIKMAGLAEGPGGFIEAFVNYRKKKNIDNDNVYGITLKSINKDIPGWKKTRDFLSNNENVVISYGKDNTGNIYNIDNIKSFINLVEKRSVDLVTADGGFDFSINFNKQEQLACRMIYCEIIMNLFLQKEGGSFVCKIFDIYTDITISFIYLLSCCYEKIVIYKPLTSRPANSEKYIVCCNFKSVDDNYLNELLLIIKKWNIVENIDKEVSQIFDINSIPNDFIDKIKNYNTFNSQQQIDNIKKTLKIIDNQSQLSNLSNIISKQTKLALEWCKKYDIEINTKSTFI